MGGERKDFWFTLAKPLICEGCGRQLWKKGMYRALTQHGRPGPVKFEPAATYRGKPKNVEVRSSVTTLGIPCSCGRDWNLRILWLPRQFGGMKVGPQIGYQVWSSETADEAFDRVMMMRLQPPMPKTGAQEYNAITEEQAALAHRRIAEIRAAMAANKI